MPQQIEVPGQGIIEFPDGMSDEQISEAIQGMSSPAPTGKGPSKLESIGMGLRDPISGLAQMLERAVPEPVAKALNKGQNWLVDKGVPGLARIPEVEGMTGMDALVQQREKDYQDKRQAAGETGVDWSRLGGNIATSLLATRGMGTPAALGGRIAQGAALGAASGAAAPVTEGDFWTEKAKQTAFGAGAGAVMPVIGAGLSRVIKPNTRPEVERLLKEGVTPTPGQILGGRWQVAEDKLTSLPLIGDAISSARAKSLDEFNRAAYKRALDPIGANLPKDVGREGVRGVRESLGQAYDDLLPKVSFKADQQFSNGIQNLRTLASQLPTEQAKQFEKIIENQITKKMTPQGLMNGARLKEVEGELGRLAKGYAGDASFDNRQLGSAIGELQNLIRQNLVRSNPDQAKALKSINSGYANYAKIRDAASRQGSADGRFTPAQLSAAVRSGDKTVGKRAFSEGTAMMQDLSDAGKNVLSSKYPDSGSIGRLALGAGALGGAYYLSPEFLGGAGLAALPFLPGGRQATAAMLARRPEIAGLIASRINAISPFLAASGGLLAAEQ